MAEYNVKEFRHHGRLEQIPIYLGKFLRGFIYQNDWKVFPMAAIIAGLVSMVVKNSLFVTMEGTVSGAFALTCVGIWNGCFNSIQVICRERGIVKREHRSGMHISSYIAAHMLYQAMLCIVQTALTVYVCKLSGVHFPSEGFMTSSFLLDISISLFLVTYASDMLSLFISAVAKNTTAAMTVMPFILIFQLVFSGGFFSLPSWAKNVSAFTVSRYGLQAIASQGDFNNLPMATGWNTLYKLRDMPINEEFTLNQVANALGNDTNKAITHFRETKITGKQVYDFLANFLEKKCPGATFTLTDESVLDKSITLGELLDGFAGSEFMKESGDKPIVLNCTVSDILNLLGPTKVQNIITEKTAAANYKPEYEKTEEHIGNCWTALALIALIGAALATITLEFIDKDKR